MGFKVYNSNGALKTTKGALTNVVEDLTPQAGGNFDFQGFGIDDAVIGATTAAAVTCTALTASGVSKLNGFVGLSVTPNFQLDLLSALAGTTAGSNRLINVSSNGSGRDAHIGFGDNVNASARIGYLGGDFYVYAGGAERTRVDTAGNFIVGKTSATLSGTGASISSSGLIRAAKQGTMLELNRITSVGYMVAFFYNGVEKGAITVDGGGVVSYNTFCGAHKSQLINKENKDIPKGTVVSTIDKAVHSLTINRVSDGETCGDYRGDKCVTGDTLTHEGEDCYIADCTQERLPRFEISTNANDCRVYGIFSHWDEYGDATIHSLGATMALVTGSCEGGDLLVSNGDGAAIVDNNAGIRDCLGKVTIGNKETTEKLVAVVLYCG